MQHDWQTKKVGTEPNVVWFLFCVHCGAAVPPATPQNELDMPCPGFVTNEVNIGEMKTAS